MNKKWKDLTTAEKVVSIFTYTAGAAAVVMFIIEICTDWNDIVGSVATMLMGITFLGESYLTWKPNRTTSIISLIAGIAVLAIGITTLVMGLLSA